MTTTYTPNGKPLAQTDANNNTSTLTYDGLDRVIRLDFPVTTVGGLESNAADYEAYTYDNANNRVSWRKRDNSVIGFTFDNLNREVVKDIPGGSTDDVYSSYDLLGRRLFARFGSTGGSGIDWGYDIVGRLTSEAYGGRTLSYQYDRAGNRTRVTWPDSFYAGYIYDGLNRVITVNENGATTGVGLLATYSYDSLGRRVTLARGNGAPTTYNYDNANRLTSLTQNPSSTAYDLTLSFVFNPSSQILQRQVSNDSYNWHPGNVATVYVPNGLNQYTTVGANGLTYDANGNLTSDGTRTFAYDVENRLLSVSAPTAVSFTYDPVGRLTTSAAGTTTIFLQSGDKLAAEYVGSTLQRRYVWGPATDEPLVWYEGTGTTDRRWLLSDNQGSIIAYTDASGAGQARYSYSPYGQPDTWSGARLRYTGQAAIPEAQLYYYRARFYDPALGRFLQTDPIGYKDDFNLYAYVKADPANNIDPSGTDCFTCLGETIQNADGTVTIRSNGFLRLLVPGQVAWDDARTAFVNGDNAKGVQYTAVAVANIGAAVYMGKLAGAPATASTATVGEANALAPNLGNKLEYLFGRALGSQHNIERSTAMLRQLERIGLPDTAANRAYVAAQFKAAYANPGVVQADGKVAREFLLTGPRGILRVESYWEGRDLITALLFGGR